MANALFSEFGSVVATTLHTAGAIAYLAGLVGYVSWARHLRQGHHNPNTLAVGQALAYVGILCNLLGGFIRTYQPGHPKLWDFGQSGWATVMVLKHAALFLGIALAVYLFEVVAPRLRRTFKEHGSQALPERTGRAAVYGVAASIFLAAILGAWSTVLPVGASGGDGDLDGDADGHGDGVVAPFEGALLTFSGQSTGSPAGGGTPSEGVFQVPAGARTVNATLVGNQALGSTPYQFTLRIIDPSGAITEASTDPTDPTVEPALPPAVARVERRVDVEVDDPVPGAWHFEVEATGAGASWHLAVALAGSEGAVFADEVSFGGGYEANLFMDEGAVIEWHWNTTARVHFNVHTHFDGAVQNHLDLDATSHHGNYTAGRDGIHSLFWTTEAPVTLTFRVTGDFSLHSAD